MKVSSTTKILIVIIVLALVAFGGVSYMFLNIRGISSETQQLANELDVTKKRRNQFDSTQEVITNNQQEMQIIRSYFIKPDTSGTASFLNRLEGLSKTTGASIRTNSVEVTSVESGVGSRLSMTLATEGAWREVYHTIALLENMPYDIDISAAQLTEGNATSTWSGTIKLSVAKRAATSTSE